MLLFLLWVLTFITRTRQILFKQIFLYFFLLFFFFHPHTRIKIQTSKKNIYIFICLKNNIVIKMDLYQNRSHFGVRMGCLCWFSQDKSIQIGIELTVFDKRTENAVAHGGDEDSVPVCDCLASCLSQMPIVLIIYTNAPYKMYASRSFLFVFLSCVVVHISAFLFVTPHYNQHLPAARRSWPLCLWIEFNYSFTHFN